MSTFKVPTKEQVSENNQAIFDNLQGKLGFVPNLYATFGYSQNALQNYLNFSGAATSLSAKEVEVVNLATSNVNNCNYCQSAHTAMAKMNGFTDEQAIEFRQGKSTINEKYNALAGLVRDLVSNRGFATEASKEAFFNAGYTKENFVDVIVSTGVKTIANYLHSATQIPVDFPAVPELAETH